MRKGHSQITAVLVLFLTLAFTQAHAQDYNAAIGYRGGMSQGGTFKYFFNDIDALEVMAATRWKGYEISACHEYHTSAFGIQSLNWYFGLGAHLGFWEGDNVLWLPEDKLYGVSGVDGIIGLEYTFDVVPINIGVNWKPKYNLIGTQGFWGDDGALSLRFVF